MDKTIYKLYGSISQIYKYALKEKCEIIKSKLWDMECFEFRKNGSRLWACFLLEREQNGIL